MALNDRRLWLIGYDIACPRRLKRLHRFLKTKAVPVQFSVFTFEGSAMQLGRLVQQIEGFIDASVDDVRIYQIPRSVHCDVLGRGSLPDGVTLISDGPGNVANVLTVYDRSAAKDVGVSLSRDA